MTMIFLHLPKTAGTSFRASLKAHFGGGYQDEYDGLPISLSPPRKLDPGISRGLRAN
jgi:hypothetical protein